MNKDDIEKYLGLLGQELQKKGLNLDILLLGGAVMVIEVGNRESTQDIDTFFLSDTAAIFRASAEVAKRENLPDGWLNSAAAGFTYNFKKPPTTHLWKKFPGLQVHLPSLEYMFVTKIMASRAKDRADIMVLAQRLRLSRRKRVLNLVTQYVNKDDISDDVLEEIEYLFK